MEIFYRRYLCFISFLFVFASLLTYNLSALPKLITLVLIGVAAVAAILALVLDKKRRFATLTVSLSVFAVFAAVLSSFVFVTLPSQKAMKLQGKYSAELEVLSCEYSSDTTSEYTVRVLRADDETPNLKAYLVCSVPSDLKYGDRIIALVDSTEAKITNKKQLDRDIFLFLGVDDSQPIMYAEAEHSNPFSMDALRSFTRSMRNSLCDYIDSLFGEDSGLVKGMLINERSDISPYTKSQFRRAGASHLLAVSGLHISLLLGAAEMLLKKICVDKKIRIVLISVGGVALMALTDFSPSAIRAVIMLFAVYVSFLFSEESDAVTSLFVAVALIVLFDPLAIAEEGLWLSFGATLGLVTLYPVIESGLRVRKKTRKPSNILLRLLLALLRTLSVTLVANIFVLPMMWYFFGEISLASLPANLLLSLLATVFLPLSALSLAVGKLGAVGELAVISAKSVGWLILKTVGFFSELRGAVLSLRYPFASVLVIAFGVAMAVVLVIRLRRKLFACIPIAAFALCFAACLAVFTVTAKPELRCIGRDGEEIIVADRAGKVSVCDMTDASASDYRFVISSLSEYSVEIENYVITAACDGHAQMLERICQTTVVRNLYIPLDTDAQRLSYADKLRTVAQKYGTKVIFYHSGDELKLFANLSVRLFFEEREDGKESVYMSFYDTELLLTYTDETLSKEASLLGSASRYFLLGSRGENVEGNYIPESAQGSARIIFLDDAVAQNSGVAEGYLPQKNMDRREFRLVIE